MKTMSKPQDKQIKPASKEKLSAEKDGEENSMGKEEARLQNKSDTAPDEFIAPTADTDQPFDDGIVNDATLRGEDHRDDNIDNLEARLKNIELNRPEKKDGKES
jgi:hypothetical protein